MILGIKNNKIILVPYDPEWQIDFAKTKTAIIQETNLLPNQIEHIGSTAIIGIKAKPIIDILIGVNNLQDLEDIFFEKFELLGFYRLRIEKE